MFPDGTTETAEGLRIATQELTSSTRLGVPQLIVILTDADNNDDADTMAAAQQAWKLGIRIFSVGKSDVGLAVVVTAMKMMMMMMTTTTTMMMMVVVVVVVEVVMMIMMVVVVVRRRRGRGNGKDCGGGSGSVIE